MQTKLPLNKEVYSVAELAKLLGVTRQTLYNEMLVKKNIGFYRVGRSYKFSRADVEAYLKNTRRIKQEATSSSLR